MTRGEGNLGFLLGVLRRYKRWVNEVRDKRLLLGRSKVWEDRGSEGRVVEGLARDF